MWINSTNMSKEAFCCSFYLLFLALLLPLKVKKTVRIESDSKFTVFKLWDVMTNHAVPLSQWSADSRQTQLTVSGCIHILEFIHEQPLILKHEGETHS